MSAEVLNGPIPADKDVRLHITGVGGDALRLARDHVVRVAEDLGLSLSQDTIGDLKLSTSEVVANALKHAGSECRVKVIWTGDHLKVAVQGRCLHRPQCPLRQRAARR
jgi:hypothetical protein